MQSLNELLAECWQKLVAAMQMPEHTLSEQNEKRKAIAFAAGDLRRKVNEREKDG